MASVKSCSGYPAGAPVRRTAGGRRPAGTVRIHDEAVRASPILPAGYRLLMAVYVVVVAFIVFWPTADVASGSVLGIWSVIHALGAPAWWAWPAA